MTIWQSISDTLVQEIEGGVLKAGGRLPGDTELAARFGVNRHTVRRALSHLQTQGLVRSERGRGTFVVEDAISYRFGAQTRFEQNLLENMRTPSRQILSTIVYGAPVPTAVVLQIQAGDPIFSVAMLGEADGIPVHFARLFFPLNRYPNAKEVFSKIPLRTSSRISLSQLISKLGTGNFKRKTARIKCRLPEAEEARHLKMSMHEPVFELEILNVDERGIPVFLGVTSYCGSRVEFLLDY